MPNLELIVLLNEVIIFAIIIIYFATKPKKPVVMNVDEFSTAIKCLELLVHTHKGAVFNNAVIKLRKSHDINPDSAVKAIGQYVVAYEELLTNSIKTILGKYMSEDHKEVLGKYMTSDSLIFLIADLLKANDQFELPVKGA